MGRVTWIYIFLAFWENLDKMPLKIRIYKNSEIQLMKLLEWSRS